MGLISDLLYTNKNGRMSKKALDLLDKRFQLVNSNVANVETPGYKAVDLKPFEQDLKNAYKNTATMRTTNERHMQGSAGDINSYQGQVETSADEPRIDGNNVDLDKEIVKMNEIGSMYQAVIAARGKRGGIISAAVESGGG